jgi:hypothetical protein
MYTIDFSFDNSNPEDQFKSDDGSDSSTAGSLPMTDALPLLRSSQ